MTRPKIMPVGIIEQSTGDSAIFTLTRPGDPSILKINSSVIVRNTHRDDEDIPSGIMVRGQVTEIGPTTATFKVVESRIGPYWPKDADTLAPGCFVHLALPDCFEIDRSQIATPGRGGIPGEARDGPSTQGRPGEERLRITVATPSPKPV